MATWSCNSQGIQGKDARGPYIEQSIQLQSSDLMAFVLLCHCCFWHLWTWKIAGTLAFREWPRMAWTWDDLSNSDSYDTFRWLEKSWTCPSKAKWLTCWLVVSHEPKLNQPRPIWGMHSLATCGWWRLLRGTCGLAVSGQQLVNGWTVPVINNKDWWASRINLPNWNAFSPNSYSIDPVGWKAG